MWRYIILFLVVENVLSWPEPHPLSLHTRPFQPTAQREQDQSLPGLFGMQDLQELSNASPVLNKVALPDILVKNQLSNITAENKDGIESLEGKQKQQINSQGLSSTQSTAHPPVQISTIAVPEKSPLKLGIESPKGQVNSVTPDNHGNILHRPEIHNNHHLSNNVMIKGEGEGELYNTVRPSRPTVPLRPLMEGVYAHKPIKPILNGVNEAKHPYLTVMSQTMAHHYGHDNILQPDNYIPLKQNVLDGVSPQSTFLSPLYGGLYSNLNPEIQRPPQKLSTYFQGISQSRPSPSTFGADPMNIAMSEYGHKQKQAPLYYLNKVFEKLFGGRFRLDVNMMKISFEPVHKKPLPLYEQFNKPEYVPALTGYYPLSPYSMSIGMQGNSVNGVDMDKPLPIIPFPVVRPVESTPVPFNSLYKQYSSMAEMVKEKNSNVVYNNLYRLYEIMKAMKSVKEEVGNGIHHSTPKLHTSNTTNAANITAAKASLPKHTTNESNKGPVRRQMQPQFSVTGKPSFDPNSMAAGQYNPNSNKYGSNSFNPNSMSAGGFDPNSMSAGGFDPNSIGAGSFKPDSMTAGTYDPNKQPIGNFDPSKFGKK